MKWEVRTMRSGTSFFDFTVFKKTVARFWPLWGAYSVLWLILLPLNGLMMLRLEADARPGVTGGYVENFANYTVPGQTAPALVLAVVFGVLAAMAVFSHLYNSRSANLFGSLPVTREGLFLTHYLAGLAFLIVPNAVIFLLTLLVEAAGGAVVMEGLLFWLAAACGECFFFYSLAVFCAMFTGHILALPAFYGIVNVLAIGLTGLFGVVLDTFYYGFAGFSDWVGGVVLWLTPVLKLGRSVTVNYATGPSTHAEALFGQSVNTFSGWGALGAYALAAAVLAVCAFFLYRARHMESAGDVVSVRPMRPVFKYGVAFCVGMVFGMGTCVVLGGGEITLMTAILIWAVIGCFAAQMLLDKSFRVFKKWKGAAAVAAVFVALFLVVGFDLTGYETRVPDAADVKSVYVQGLSAVNFEDSGDIVNLDIEDPEQIELLTTLHRAAVEDRGDRWRTGTVAHTRLDLDYTLNNGSTLRRSYYVDVDPADINREGAAAWALERLYHDTGLYWRVYGFDKLEKEIERGGRLDSAEFSHYEDDMGTVSMVAGYGADARALLDAVEEDFKAGRVGVRTLTDWQSHMSSTYRPSDSLRFRVVDPAKGGTVYAVEIAIQDTASSTLAELSRLAEENPELAEALRAGGWMK